MVKGIVLGNVTISTEDFSEENITTFVSRLNDGSFDFNRRSASNRPLETKSFGSHLARLIFFTLHLQLLGLGKEFVDRGLQSLTVDHAPGPLVAAFSKLMPCDQTIFICLPVGEKTLVFVFFDTGDFTDDTLIGGEACHHLDQVLLRDSLLRGAFGEVFLKDWTHLVLLPFSKGALSIPAKASSVLGFLGWYRQGLAFIRSLLKVCLGTCVLSLLSSCVGHID